MSARVLADGVVVLHALFVVFVVAGGALVVWRPRFALLHLPAAAWGAWVEFAGTTCPLTPLENQWRRVSGDTGYQGGFVEHYLIPVLYPDGLTPRTQVALGIVVVAVNATLYGLAWRRARRGRPIPGPK
jgi:hypothetical protein